MTWWGEAQRYYENVVLTFEGTDCLIWPYAVSESGYGKIWRRGALRVVTRELLIDRHGPPPTPAHEAAHSCGNGHLGCCALAHLSWKTRTENESDKIDHGTKMLGERNHRAKLSDDQARAILTESGLQREIAARYGITQSMVSRIKSGDRRYAPKRAHA